MDALALGCLVIEVCEGKPEVLEIWDLGEGRAEALEVCKGKTGRSVKVKRLYSWSMTSESTRLRYSTSAKGRLRYLRLVGQD